MCGARHRARGVRLRITPRHWWIAWHSHSAIRIEGVRCVGRWHAKVLIWWLTPWGIGTRMRK
jgi:hypothetical protein